MKKSKLIFRIILVLVGLIATVTTVLDRLPATGGDGNPIALYFTAWSVWLATAAAIWVLIQTFRGKDQTDRAMLLVKFCANIMIIATFIVAGFVLPAKLWTAQYWTFGGIFKHFLLPILTVVDSACFDNSHHMKLWYPFAGGVAPLIYWVAVILRMCTARAGFGGAIPETLWDAYYPYGFTNLDNGHSLGGLCGMLAGILVGLIIIGFVFVLIDKKTNRIK